MISEVSFEGDDLLQAAKAHNLKVLTTDFFTTKGPEKDIPDRTKFASLAFDLSEMEISNIEELKDGYYILQVVEKIPETIPALEAVKQDVVADLVEKKQNERADEDADALLSALQNGQSLSVESKKFNVTPITTGFFKRNDSIPEIGFEREISATAFTLTKKNKLPEKVIRGRKGYYVIQLNNKKAPESEGFEKEKIDIEQRLKLQKQSKAFAALLSQLKDTGEISIKEGFLD